MKTLYICYFTVCLSYCIYNIIRFDSKYYKINFIVEKIEIIPLNEGKCQLVSINYIDSNILITDKIQLSTTDYIMVGDSFPGFKLINGDNEVFPYNKYIIVLYGSSSLKFYFYTLFIFIFIFILQNIFSKNGKKKYFSYFNIEH